MGGDGSVGAGCDVWDSSGNTGKAGGSLEFNLRLWFLVRQQ